MGRRILLNDEAKNRIFDGTKILYEAVKTTLGPLGRNVVIGRTYGSPTVTHDGVTVAKNVELHEEDNEHLGEKVGVELIRQAASKMNDVAGDGTTTVTVLTYHLLKQANKLISGGYNPMLLKKGIELASKQALDLLPKYIETIKDPQRTVEIATISAGGDREIGKLISGVMEKVGSDGTVTVEQGRGLELECEVVEGFTFDQGYVSPYMITDQTRLETVYENVNIFVTDKKLSGIQELVPLLEGLAKRGNKELLVIAEDVDGEVLSTFILNKVKGQFNAVAVKAPSFGEQRGHILEDIAILTGATFVNSNLFNDLKEVNETHLGFARKVIVTKDSTTIIQGGGEQQEVDNRIKELTKQIEVTKTDYDKENLEKRRASLNGKVAVIKVGGVTETEIEEKKFRVDDAVAATKAALAEGIVAGGGVTLVNLSTLIVVDNENDSIKAGQKLFIDALQEPFKQLLINSDLNPAEWLSSVKESQDGFGIDVTKPTKELIDLKKNGIIDPALVVREVIRNAVSVAGIILTTGALVVEVPEENSPPAPF